MLSSLSLIDVSLAVTGTLHFTDHNIATGHIFFCSELQLFAVMSALTFYLLTCFRQTVACYNTTVTMYCCMLCFVIFYNH